MAVKKIFGYPVQVVAKLEAALTMAEVADLSGMPEDMRGRFVEARRDIKALVGKWRELAAPMEVGC